MKQPVRIAVTGSAGQIGYELLPRIASGETLPLTSQLRSAGEPLRIPIAPRDRLKKLSYIMVDKMRAMDRGHFGKGPIASLMPDEMMRVERSLKAVLGFL